jgi:hypothetical protein
VPAWVIDELMGHQAGRRGEREGSMIGTRYRYMTEAMQARVVAVIERLAVALAVMPHVCPKPDQGRTRRADARGATGVDLLLCGGGLPGALSGAAIPDPQSKAAAQPDGGRLASHTARRRPARAVAQVNAFPLTRRGQPVLQREDQPVGGMKMCTLLIGSNQAVAAPPGAMILRTPFSTMVTP